MLIISLFLLVIVIASLARGDIRSRGQELDNNYSKIIPLNNWELKSSSTNSNLRTLSLLSTITNFNLWNRLKSRLSSNSSSSLRYQTDCLSGTYLYYKSLNQYELNQFNYYSLLYRVTNHDSFYLTIQQLNRIIIIVLIYASYLTYNHIRSIITILGIRLIEINTLEVDTTKNKINSFSLPLSSIKGDSEILTNDNSGLVTKIDSEILPQYLANANGDSEYLCGIQDWGLFNNLFNVNLLNLSFEWILLIFSAIIIYSITNSDNEITELSNYKQSDYSTNSHSRTEGNNSWNTWRVITTKVAQKSELFILILFNIIAALLLINANDLITIYVSIELQSFSLYLISSIFTNYSGSITAGFKYFILGSLASILILIGLGLVYYDTGLTNLNSLAILLNSIHDYNSCTDMINIGLKSSYNLSGITSLNIGCIFILSGLFFKIAAAPFHYWAPDVYDWVPTIITLWLNIIPKLALLIVLLNLIIILPVKLYIILLLTSILSLIIGSIFGLTQTKIKRLLTYSSISHIGFLLLALACNSFLGFNSYLFYILTYLITNTNNFLIIIAFGIIATSSYTHKLRNKDSKSTKDVYSPIKFIKDLKGGFNSNRSLAVCFMISLFSLAGLPPLIGFFAKFLVLKAALESHLIFITLISIIISIITAYYYLRIMIYLISESEIDTKKKTQTKTNIQIELIKKAKENIIKTNKGNRINKDLEIEEVVKGKKNKIVTNNNNGTNRLSNSSLSDTNISGIDSTSFIDNVCGVPILSLNQSLNSFLPNLPNYPYLINLTNLPGDFSSPLNPKSSSNLLFKKSDSLISYQSSSLSLNNPLSFSISLLTLIISLFFINPKLILHWILLLSLVYNSSY